MHFSNLPIPDAIAGDGNFTKYAALRRYAVYLINFCEDVAVDDADQSIRDLFEPICKMLEILSTAPETPAVTSQVQFRASSGHPDISDLLELVMKDVSFMYQAQGMYSFSFSPVSDSVAANVYSSGSKVLAFAAASCYLQYKLENAFPNSPPA